MFSDGGILGVPQERIHLGGWKRKEHVRGVTSEGRVKRKRGVSYGVPRF